VLKDAADMKRFRAEVEKSGWRRSSGQAL